jgi:hypothetical protein
LCAEFPRCLPPLPTNVAAECAELLDQPSSDYESLRQRLTFLEQLDDAIARGLGRKDEQ